MTTSAAKKAAAAKSTSGDEPAAQPAADNPTPAAEKPKRAYKPVEVGEVTVSVAADQKPIGRPSTLDSNPVAQAVKNAERGKLYDLRAEPDKMDGVLSILTRAQQRYGVKVQVPTKQRDTGLIQFIVTERVASEAPSA